MEPNLGTHQMCGSANWPGTRLWSWTVVLDSYSFPYSGSFFMKEPYGTYRCVALPIVAAD
jgi:hypothetical protein